MSRTFVHVGHEHCMEFIEGHTRLAFKQGFNDNVGRNAGVAYFRLAQLHRWVDVFEKMVHFFRNVNEIDIDAKFSEVRCSKAYPVALQAYHDNLPPYYDEFVHQAKVAYALKVFRAKAKGPTVQRLAEELRRECEEFWKSGHETCKEKVSLRLFSAIIIILSSLLLLPTPPENSISRIVAACPLKM